MREAHVGELRERAEEVRRKHAVGLRALVAVRADVAAEAVDGLVAAPQDPVVGRQPVVVEPVAGVSDPLAVVPPDAPELLVGQRLGDERVVVDGRDVAPHRAHERRVGARREQRAPRAHAPAGRLHAHAGAVAPHTGDRRLLVKPHAELERHAAQPPRQPRRVDDRLVVAVPGAGEVGRRVELGAHRVAVEQVGRLAVAAQRLGVLAQVLDLVGLGGDGQRARRLPVGVDRVALERPLERHEVRPAERLELRHLAREVRDAVVEPVRERCVEEAAVAPGGAEGHGLRLEQRHVAARVLLLGLDRGPQAREAAADDHEVGALLAREGRRRRGRVRAVEPEDPRRGVGQRCLVIGDERHAGRV